MSKLQLGSGSSLSSSPGDSPDLSLSLSDGGNRAELSYRALQRLSLVSVTVTWQHTSTES